jgi:hypothetical protein
MNKQSQFARRCRGPLYKQTQFGPARAVSAGQFCGTKPIPSVGRRRNVPNKAKLGRTGVSGGGWRIKQGNSAKRSQLPEAGHRGGVWLRRVERGLAGEGRCTNKPSSWPRRTGRGRRDEGRLRQINPILGSRPLAAVVLMGRARPEGNRRDAHATKRLAASLRTGLLRQTNPIGDELVCRGRPPCLPCFRATTLGQPQGVALTGSCRRQFETSNSLRLSLYSPHRTPEWVRGKTIAYSKD